MTAHRRTSNAAALLVTLAFATAAHADPSGLTVEIGGLDASGRLPDRAAFCAPESSASRNVRA